MSSDMTFFIGILVGYCIALLVGRYLP